MTESENVPSESGGEPRTSGTSGSVLAERLTGLTPVEQERAVLEIVHEQTVAALRRARPDTADSIDTASPFLELGFDSMSSVDLHARLVAATGVALPITVVYDHPTPVELSRFVRGRALGIAPEPVAITVPRTVRDDDEPIAIVGIGCHYPGGIDSPESFWEVMAEGREVLGDFPTDRGWDIPGMFDPDPDRPGKSYVDKGGFLAGATEFDADFFKISPREALAMDPQQRLILETSWEALERAGINPASLRGSRTAVFFGAEVHEYGTRVHQAPVGLDGYLMTGNAPSVVSGRVSYALGLEGPAVTVDTACSGSIVSLHLAVRALRDDECTLALVGGVAVMGSPGMFTAFSRQRGLAPDGRCKAFSEAADGTGFAEGAGVFVMERLSDARRNGHPVLAVVRGSAVNQDGASNGLTAPNGPSQQRLILQALADAGLRPADVDAVDAHGTGTKLGDPIEAQAILATYGQDRPEDRPLWLGSAKSNLGHTQAAGGAASVIKMVLAMRHGTLPRTLHVNAPSPHVDWSTGRVELLTEARPWDTPDGRPRRAGVSAFGISGTNAHVIIEEPPPVREEAPERPDAGSTAPPLVLSARTEEALKAQARGVLELLEPDDAPDLADVAVALATTRAELDHRAVVPAVGREEALAGLRALAEGVEAPGNVRGRVSGGRLAFLFTGQGAQRLGMGRGLAEAFPVFAEALDEVCGHLDLQLDPPLREVMFAAEGSDEAALLDRTEFAQPALFAIEVALFRLVESWGVRPDVVAGHSIGEIAAAHVAGVFSLADAAALVAARGRLMQALPEGGTMAAVQATEDEVRALLATVATADDASIAAINGPNAVVVSGTTTTIGGVVDALKAQGRKATYLKVSHAFHSPLMNPVLDEFTQLAHTLDYNQPTLPFVSTVTGTHADPAVLATPEYWVTHIHETVHFTDAIHTLIEDGVTRYLEVGPDTTLTALTTPLLPDNTHAHALLHRNKPEPHHTLTTLAHLWAHGHPITWTTHTPHNHNRPVDLPTYPFQRQRYWLAGAEDADVSALGQLSADHPLLGALVNAPGSDATILTGRISTRSHPWLDDHTITGTPLLPGTAFVELALHAGHHTGAPHLAELTLHAPLALRPDAFTDLRVQTSRADRSVTIHSRPHGDITDGEWTLHATGTLAPEVPAPNSEFASTSWPPPGATPLPLDDTYAELAARGYDYGPVFQGLKAAWRQGHEVFAEVSLPAPAHEEAVAFALHPALLDAALHATDLGEVGPRDERTVLPFVWSGVSLHATGATTLRVRISRSGEDSLRLLLSDPAGQPVAEVDRLVMRPVSAARIAAAGTGEDSRLYAVEWDALPVDAGRTTSAAGEWAVLGCGAGPWEEWTGAVVHADLRALAEVPGPVPETVVLTCRPGTGGVDVPGRVREVTSGVLEVLQQWLVEDRFASSRLVVVTRGAVDHTDGSGESVDLVGATVWGLVRSAQAEHPGRFTLLDWDGVPCAPSALTAALSTDEPELALRSGTFRVSRLARVTAGDDPADGFPTTGFGAWGAEDTLLITGGTGGLAALAAEHLVTHHGVRSLALASRGGPSAPHADGLVRHLTDLGAHVTVHACDVSDPTQVTELVGGLPHLRGVIHTAGVVEDAVLANQTTAHLDTVLAPKADAAWYLHQATAGLDLTHFVLYSSAAATLDGAGQANYAAANAFLDALAHHRAANGLPAHSLGWGLWNTDRGMGARLTPGDLARLDSGPLRHLTTAQNLSRFDAALASRRPALLPVGINPRHPAQPLTANLRAAAPIRPTAHVGTRTPSGPQAVTRLGGLDPAERGRAVLDLVRTHIAGVLHHDGPSSVDPARAFTEIGFDSLSAVELRNRLNQATELRLPATLVFDYPTPQALADHLDDTLFGDAAPTPAPVVAPDSVPDEPIAIVGMSCRFPGSVNTPEQLWELLANGRDGVSAFPTDRGWNVEEIFDPEPGKPGKTYAIEGGFLHDAAEFDAEFFGISPREAIATDPQQRLLLETSWEALERAGIDPHTLRGSRTGVFTGIMYHDYASRLGNSPLPEGIDTYLGNGSLGSIASGRVSYVFGLEGPAVTVDTACSSSLVALHWAIQALRGGECQLALAGGATVMSTPDTFIDFSRQRGLASDGRIRSFAEAADGTGWGEGVGVLVVERLSDARRNGHRVLAVVRGSAVNQDGASNGLTAPNGPSQQRVIRQALTTSGLTPTDIQAVEAHGTGTVLGDPIEAQALLATYGQDRVEDDPLWLGSIKSNIGHTQAAAGVAGVIKMVMAMRHGVLPRTLHVDEPSSKVDWSAGRVELLTESRSWEAVGPRRAGVSSFGISGTNAHVILEEAPEEPVVEDVPRPSSTAPVPLLLSARSPQALKAQAQALLDLLESENAPHHHDLAAALTTQRAQLDHRAAVITTHHHDTITGLKAITTNQHPIHDTTSEGRLAFLFTGQGAQRLGMGQGLAEAFPVFADALDEVCGVLDPLLSRPLREVMFAAEGSDEAALLDRTEFAQPALFAIEVALFRLVESWGVRPDVVAGHSIGEIAAAHVAGVFSLADAAALVAARGRLMQALPEGGTMAAVQATEDEVRALLATIATADDASIAAINGPNAVVVSGTTTAIGAVVDKLKAQGRKATYLKVSHAFHSPLMNPVLDEFATMADRLNYTEPTLPFVSTVTGTLADPAELATPRYWTTHIREAVRFHDAVNTLARDGVTRFLEVGPDAVLTAITADALPDAQGVRCIPLLRHNTPEAQQALTALAHLWAHGHPITWTTHTHHNHTRPVDLPTYPFQHQHYWLSATTPHADITTAGLIAAEHPLLGAAVTLPESSGVVLTGRVGLRTHAWLADHVVMGAAILPGAALVELALRAGDHVNCGLLEELTLEAPFVLPENGARDLRVTVGEPDAAGRRTVGVHSRDLDSPPDAWTRHASGFLAPDAGVATAGVDLTVWPPEGATSVDVRGLYGELATGGLDYGPAFRGLRTAWRRGEEVFAEVHLPEEAHGTVGGFGLHPVLLDAALHASELLGGGSGESGRGTHLPFAWSDVVLHASGATALRVRLSAVGGDTETVSLDLADPAGTPVASVRSMAARPVSAEQITAARGGSLPLYHVEWVPAPTPLAAEEVPGDWVVLGPEADTWSWTGLRTCRDLAALGDAVPPVVVLPCPVPAFDAADPDGRETLPGLLRAALGEVLDTLQRWLAEERLSSSRLVVLTRGDGGPAGLVDAAVGGLVRAAQEENPGCFVLAGWDGAPDSLRHLAAAVASGEPRVSVTSDGVYAARLAEVAVPENRVTGFESWGPQDTLLITGGTGGLATLIAEHLITQHGIKHLALASRQGPHAPNATHLTQHLTQLGAHITLHTCDMGNPTHVTQLINNLPHLKGIIHTAGTLHDATLTNQTPTHLHTTLTPKADAAWHLHHATTHLHLTHFILYSSATSTLDNAGQANYAAANAFLDALAHHRTANGLPAHSLAWGLWNTGRGMAAALTRSDLERLNNGHLLPLTAAQNLALFDAALATARPVLLPVRINPRRPVPPLTDGLPLTASPALSRPTAHTGAPNGVTVDPATLEQRLAPLDEEEQLRLLEDVICVEVAAVLGHADASALDPGKTFQDSGFDSLTAVELRNRLKKTTGQRLSATLIFDYPTPQALAKYLLEEVRPAIEEITASVGAGGVPEADEAALRRIIASVPLDRIREAGLLDALLALAPAGPAAGGAAPGEDRGPDAPAAADGPDAVAGHGDGADQSGAILAMDIDDLVREAFERSDAERPE